MENSLVDDFINLCEQHGIVVSGTLRIKYREDLKSPLQVVEFKDTIKYPEGRDTSGPFLDLRYVVEEEPFEPSNAITNAAGFFIGDPVRQGVTKIPQGFREGVLQRIKHTVPGNVIDA